MSQVLDDKTLQVLTDIRSYLRITAAASSRQAAGRVIDSQEKAIAYSKMDGKTSSYQIADALDIPPRTVANWAEDFVISGLASPPNELFASHRALFFLNELSVNSSELKNRKKREQVRLPISSALPVKTITTGSHAGERRDGK
jgi:hypothetical protein